MNTKKIGLGALAVAALGYLGWWIYTRSKKTYKELERREEENAKILSKTGLTEEQVDNISVGISAGDDEDCVPNMCKELFSAVRFSSEEIPQECVDVDEILNKDTQHVIHVVQRFDKVSSREVLDFLFEIPTSALLDDRYGGRQKRSYKDGNTCVQDFAKAIKGIYDRDREELIDRGYVGEMEKIAKDPENLGLKISGGKFFIDSRIDGYYYINFEALDEETGEWYERSGLVRIDKSVYENNPWNEEHTRVTEFVYDLRQAYSVEGAEYIVIPTDEKVVRNAKVIDAIAVIRTTFNIQGGHNLDGINVTSGLKILEDIYNNFEVHKNHGTGNETEKDMFTYDYFLFYNPRQSGDRLEVFDTENGDDGKVHIVLREFV